MRSSPNCCRADKLAQANSLDQLIRPLALRLAGPALGGLAVGAIGAGWAFALDAGSFAISVAALLAMSRAPGSVARSASGETSADAEAEPGSGFQ